MKYCSKCGKEVTDSEVFCPACGAKIPMESTDSGTSLHSKLTGTLDGEYIKKLQAHTTASKKRNQCF